MPPRNAQLLVIAAAVTIVGACTTTRHVQRPATAEELQQQIAANSASIGSRDPNARDPVTLLYEPAPGGAQGAATLTPTSDANGGGAPAAGTDLTLIRGYEVTRRIPGAVGGLLIGLAGGVAAGAVYGFSLGDDPPCDFCLFPLEAKDKAILLGFMGGITGGLFGAAVGALVGRRDSYLF